MNAAAEWLDPEKKSRSGHSHLASAVCE